MNKLALTDKEQYPDESILAQILQQFFPLYQEVVQQLQEKGIEITWQYYNDGKAWLGKLIWKKKNLGWLHVYHSAFKITVYFTEKYRTGVMDLDIPQDIKDTFQKATPSGKLIPLTLPIEQEQDVTYLLLLTDYKKKCR